MQVYSILNVLTARPGAHELRRAPHLLYGNVHPATAYSTGAWLRDVMELADQGAFDARRPIFVGGTGLYFRALAEGISDMPDVPAPVRDQWRYRLEEEGPARLHRILFHEDPEAAMSLRPSDGQRIARALEVLEASGRSILKWQAERGRPLVDRSSGRFLVIEPARVELIARIDARFDQMVKAGVADEVKVLSALELDPTLPAMKAIGVREFQAAAAGRMTAEDAIARAKIATRQYAKRQATWFRHQFGPEWRRISGTESPENLNFG